MSRNNQLIRSLPWNKTVTIDLTKNVFEILNGGDAGVHDLVRVTETEMVLFRGSHIDFNISRIDGTFFEAMTPEPDLNFVAVGNCRKINLIPIGKRVF